MGRHSEKKEILSQAEYTYSFDLEVYYNHQTNKVFSLEFIEDNSAEDLKRRIGENEISEEWHFYFNAAPSETVRRELERVLR